jgi:C_GCAxxG_C_C family probable redox protein
VQETLDLKDKGAFKAASGLAGGIARRGETCGALLGAIMAVCQVVGRESIEDVEQYRAAMEPCGELYLKFKEEVGHTMCAEIHKILYGRTFRLCVQEEHDAFVGAGGHAPDGCPSVCSKAARIAASFILDSKKG